MAKQDYEGWGIGPVGPVHTAHPTIIGYESFDELLRRQTRWLMRRYAQTGESKTVYVFHNGDILGHIGVNDAGILTCGISVDPAVDEMAREPRTDDAEEAEHTAV